MYVCNSQYITVTSKMQYNTQKYQILKLDKYIQFYEPLKKVNNGHNVYHKFAWRFPAGGGD